MDQHEKMLLHYPDFLSKEQFYKVCHIGKDTALKLFRSGLVPAVDTKQKTRRYLIAKSDVITYLREREVDPQKFHLSKRTWTQTYEPVAGFNKTLSTKFKSYTSKNWCHEPDLLSVADLHRLLGYQLSTIRKWIAWGSLQSIKIGGIYYIPKCYAIDFIASESFYGLSRKSNFHLTMIKECSECVRK